MTATLQGYRYSVGSWIARLALLEKGMSFDGIEIDPLSQPLPADDLGSPRSNVFRC